MYVWYFLESGGRTVNENKALTSKKNRYKNSAVIEIRYLRSPLYKFSYTYYGAELEKKYGFG